jgi:hypothetical protein
VRAYIDKIRSRDGLSGWRRTLVVLFATGAILATQSAQVAAQPGESVALRVAGDVPNTLEIGEADFAALPRHTLNVTDEGGAKITYEGVAVIELLRRAGAPLGKELKGQNLTLCVMARAFDGYRAAFALAELDPGIGNLDVIVADRRDGKALDAHEGPLRLIVLGDKRHARWVKGLTTLSVERLR